jgi:hypothetical protein
MKPYTPAEVEKLIEWSTDGPWLVEREGTNFCVSGAGSDLACFDYFDGSDADAELIAAAPTIARQFVEQAKTIESLKELLWKAAGIRVGDTPINQCDGCHTYGDPDAGGIHRDERNKPVMCCQKFRYTSPLEGE